MMQIFRFLFLPIVLLTLGVGCGGHSNKASAPGTPPTITAGPANTSTVVGRKVMFTVTAAGAATLRYQWAKDGVTILGALTPTFTLYAPQLSDAGAYTVTVTNPNGTLTSAPATLTVAPALAFTSPVGVVADAAGNLFVSDSVDHVIWQVSATKQVTLLAGSQGLAGSADGQGSAARFRNPGGLALDPAGNLVVADTGNHTLRRVAMDGTVTTLAGAAGLPGSTNAVGTLARFNAPDGVAVDGTGGVYVADSQNHTIRFMALDGTVSTYAGAAGQPGHTDATGTAASFNQPNGLALAPNGTLYVADYGNSTIRSIGTNALVATLAGTATTTGSTDGTGAAALFNLPVGITVDANGLLWVADTHNHTIRSITSAGVVHVMAGLAATGGNSDGTGTSALFNLPCGITSTPLGNLVVADTSNHMLRQVTPGGVVTTL